MNYFQKRHRILRTVILAGEKFRNPFLLAVFHFTMEIFSIRCLNAITEADRLTDSLADEVFMVPRSYLKRS